MLMLLRYTKYIVFYFLRQDNNSTYITQQGIKVNNFQQVQSLYHEPKANAVIAQMEILWEPTLKKYYISLIFYFL